MLNEESQEYDLGSLFSHYITQLGTMCGRPIENSVSIVVNFYSYEHAGLAINYQEQ